MGVIEKMVIGGLIFSGVFLLLISLTLEGTDTLDVSYTDTQLTQINSSINEFTNKTTIEMQEIKGVSSATNSTSISDNPLNIISFSIFNAIPFLFNFISYIPELIINILSLSPFTIPNYITSLIVIGILASFVFAIIVWIRSGVGGL